MMHGTNNVKLALSESTSRSLNEHSAIRLLKCWKCQRILFALEHLTPELDQEVFLSRTLPVSRKLLTRRDTGDFLAQKNRKNHSETHSRKLSQNEMPGIGRHFSEKHVCT